MTMEQLTSNEVNCDINNHTSYSDHQSGVKYSGERATLSYLILILRNFMLYNLREESKGKVDLMTILLPQDHVTEYTYIHISIWYNMYIRVISYNSVYTGCRILSMLINLACFVNNVTYVTCRITQISQIRCSYSSLQVTFFSQPHTFTCLTDQHFYFYH